MNKSLPSADVIATQLDRLVSGDLAEPDRRSLLAWLDEEPARWRACALAFLEAQVWEQAITSAAVKDPCAVGNALRGVPQLGSSALAGIRSGSQDDQRSWLGWLAIAAAVLVAFAAGALSGQRTNPAPTRQSQSVIAGAQTIPAAAGLQLATVSVRTSLDPRLTAQVQLPVEPAAEPVAGASSISEYDRKLWERRGYEVVEEVRYLPAKMPDGRTVMVPVNRVHLKVKGTPVS